MPERVQKSEKHNSLCNSGRFRVIAAPNPAFKEVGRDLSIEFIAPDAAALFVGQDKVEPVNETVNETVFSVIKSNTQATYSEIMQATGLSCAQVARQIQRLKQEGYIQRSGSDKTGRWIILK